MHRRRVCHVAIGALSLGIAGCTSDRTDGTPSSPTDGQTTAPPTTTPATPSPTTEPPSETPTSTATDSGSTNVHQLGERFTGPLDAIGWKATNSRVEPSIGNASADGRFVLVHLDATESAGETVTISSGVIRLEDGSGTRYAVDETGMNAVDTPFEFGEVYPGTGIDGDLVFDVPDDATDLRLRIGDTTVHFVELGLSES